MQLGLTIDEFCFLDGLIASCELNEDYKPEDFPLVSSIRAKIDFLRSL